METKAKRVGRLIKTIGNNPGITLSGLCDLLQARGVKVSPRTVANDILSIKQDYELLPREGRLRRGYQLADLAVIGQSEYGVVADALCAFALTLSDPEAEQVVNRLLKSLSNLYDPVRSGQIRKRLIGQKVICEDTEQCRLLEHLIMSAVRECMAMKLKYRSPRTNGAITLHAYPLFKVFYERAWYFIVRDQKTDSYYPCRLDRVLEAQVLAAPANEDYANNVADAAFLISRGWGMTFPKSYKELEKLDNVPETIVRFHSTVAPYILEGKRRHPCARIKHARDGSGDVLFHIRLLDHWEFKHWVRGFGSSATIIAPATIVDQERAEVVRTARNYGCESRLPRT